MLTVFAPRNRELLIHLTMRELRSKYKRTILGWGWSMLNPLLMALIYTVVFGSFFDITAPPGNPSGVSNFTFFLLAGLLPWAFVVNAISMGIVSIVGNAGLIQKVAFRRESLVVAAVVSSAVSLCIELSVYTGFLFAITQKNALPYLPIAFLVVVLQTIFLLGLALALAAANVYFRDLQYLTNVGLTAWMYLTPVVYAITFVPLKGHVFGKVLPTRFLIRLNPMTRFIGAYRECLYDLRFPSIVTWASLVVSAAASLLIGGFIFQRLQSRFAEEL